MPKRQVVIMRGWPGMGKSTAIEGFFERCPKNMLMAKVSADLYWEYRGKDTFREYVFDPKKLGEAHAFCQGMFFSEIFDWDVGKDRVIFVDNTNIKVKDFQWYLDMAELAGYDVFQYVPQYIHPKVAYERNVHGVPEETVMRMAEQYETVDLPRWELGI